MQTNPAASPTVDLPIDGAFLRRVYALSLGVAVLGGFVLGQRLSTDWGLGFAIFAAWSTANLYALDRLLRLIVRRDERQPVLILAATLIKIPLLYGLGIFIAVAGGFPATSLMAGFSVPLAVVVLKVIGRLLARRVSLDPHTTR